MRDILAVIGAVTVVSLIGLAVLVAFLARRAAQAIRPYRDEHQGAA